MEKNTSQSVDCSAAHGPMLFVYVSDYYHAKAYQAEAVSADSEDYIVYGDKNSSTGFIFYPGGWWRPKAMRRCLTNWRQKTSAVFW